MDKPWIAPIRRLLTAKNWSQGELAKKAKIRPSTLSEALNGRSPRMDTFEQIAAAFQVPLYELFVSDEQSTLLREATQQRQALAKQEELAAIVIRQLAPAVAQAVAAAVASTGSPVSESVSQGSAPEVTPPADALARGRLQPGKPARRKTA